MVKKSITVGAGGAQAPTDRTGGSATVKESVDKKVRTITWGNNDMDRLKIKKKKKKLKKADMNAKIVAFLQKNLEPSDKQIHALAEELGIDEHKFEEKIYKLLDSHLNKAFTKEQAEKLGEDLGIDWDKSKFTLKQLLQGMKVELEHKDVTQGDPKTTAKIALAHLKEDADYYTKLKQVESGDKVKKDFDRELFSSIFKKARHNYPDLELNSVVRIATEVYKKKTKQGEF